MSLPVTSTLALATGGGAASKSGPFQRLSLELLFEITENGLRLADFLAFASTNKHLLSKLIGRLLEQGMKANMAPLLWACTKHGSGPALLHAIVKLHPQGRQFLSSFFEHEDNANVLGQTPLIVAIRAANLRVVKLLIKYGVDAHQPERYPSIKSACYSMHALWSPIHFAVGYDMVPNVPEQLSSSNSLRLREDIVRHLLQKGAVDIGKCTEAMDPCAVMSPLFLHIINGPSNIRAAIVRQLLRHGSGGVQPSFYRVHWIPETTRMVSPLSILITKCRQEKHVPDEVLEVAALLIRAGDGGGRQTTTGTPLIMECLNPCENMRWFHLTEMLLSSGRQSARSLNTQGEPAVVWLIIRLLDYQLWFEYNNLYASKMEKQNKYDTARGCTYRMLQLLLHHGADINARCPASHSEYPGATALIVAASIRDELHDVFLDLLESGAEAKARDSKGRNAYFGLFAGQLSNPNDRIQALSEAGAPINAADKNGNTPLHYAAKYSRRHFSNWLPKMLAHGCDLDKRNMQDETFVDVLCKDARPDQREVRRKRILVDIEQAKEDVVKVKKQEKNQKYRLKVAAAAEQHPDRYDAAKAAEAASQAGPNTGQSGASTAKAGFSAAQTGASTAQIGASTAQAGASSARAGFSTSPAGASTARAGFSTTQNGSSTARMGFGNTQAGPSTAPVARANQRRPDRGVHRSTTQSTHKRVQVDSNTRQSYTAVAQASLGAGQAGSGTVAQAADQSEAFPGATASATLTDDKPPGFW